MAIRKEKEATIASLPEGCQAADGGAARALEPSSMSLPQCKGQVGLQSPRTRAGVLLPVRATGAESFDFPLGILSSRDRGCKSMAHSQGCVTPRLQPWLQGTALRLTSRSWGDVGSRAAKPASKEVHPQIRK